MQANSAKNPVPEEILLQECLLGNTKLIHSLQECLGLLASGDCEVAIKVVVKNKTKLKALESDLKEKFEKREAPAFDRPSGISGLALVPNVFRRVQEAITTYSVDVHGEKVGAMVVDLLLADQRAEQQLLRGKLLNSILSNKSQTDGAASTNP